MNKTAGVSSASMRVPMVSIPIRIYPVRLPIRAYTGHRFRDPPATTCRDLRASLSTGRLSGNTPPLCPYYSSMSRSPGQRGSRVAVMVLPPDDDEDFWLIKQAPPGKCLCWNFAFGLYPSERIHFQSYNQKFASTSMVDS
jgi:hypothetical protein